MHRLFIKVVPSSQEATLKQAIHQIEYRTKIRHPMNNFSYLFLAMLAITIGFQWWLGNRHLRHVLRHRAEVPVSFREQIPLQAHQKAADYTVARGRFGRIETVTGAVFLLFWTLGGGLALLDNTWQGLGLGPTATGVGVMLSAILIMSILDIPGSAYFTFVIEERFGFNKNTPRLFVIDLFKAALLLLVIGTPLLWLVLWIMEIAGPVWWLYVWAVWFGFSLLMMWAYPAFIAPLFNRFEPLADRELGQRIEALLQQCGFKSNGIFVMDGSRRSAHGNAYFSGLGNNKRIVFFDTLIKQLDADEIEAVLAHELGHFRLRHIRKRLLGMGVISLASLALLGWLAQQPWFYAGFNVNPSNHMALMLFMLLSPVFSFFLTPLFSWLSRRHEFEADAYAAGKRDSAHLIRALVKMYEENASTLTPDPLYSRFYDSHPPAPIRINHLRQATAA